MRSTAAVSTITSDYRPGIIGRIVEMHASYYARHWGLGLFFETKVAQDLTEFLRAFPNPDARLWHAVHAGVVVGSGGLDGRYAREKGAHLRWFIIDDGERGTGLGRRLLGHALSFAREQEYRSVYLWTFAGLDAARHLYESFGFQLVEQADAMTWGIPLTEQRFILALQGAQSV